MSTSIVVHCDQPVLIERGMVVGTCARSDSFAAETVSGARGRATSAGWAQVGDLDLCPFHNAARGLPGPPSAVAPSPEFRPIGIVESERPEKGNVTNLADRRSEKSPE